MPSPTSLPRARSARPRTTAPMCAGPATTNAVPPRPEPLADHSAYIVKLHGVPSRIVSDRITQFTSKFWKRLHEAMRPKLDFRSAYHPQTDGQTKRINQIMEDMLRACVLTYGIDWEKSLSYAQFSNNKSYQASLGMSPFEVLYGRKCRTPFMWLEVEERTLLGPAFIKHSEERVAEIREKLKEAQSW